MADFGTSPAITTPYADVLTFLRDRDEDLAKMFDGTTTTNIITGTIKWLSASGKFQKYNGTAWVDQIVAVAGGGTGAADAATARTNLGLGTVATQAANAVAITGGSITDLTTFTARAAGFSIKDGTDATKVMKFNLASMTTGVTRTLVPPNGDTTLVGTDTTQTLTNKNFDNCTATTQAVGDNSTKVASTAFVQQAIPSGVILAWPAAVAPPGYLLCYGQSISRTTFAALFAAIGTTFGSGDGSTTFNVPDLRGLLLFGNQSMGGTNRAVLDGSVAHSVLGAVWGSQYHTHSLSLAGATAGSLGVTTTSFSMDGPNMIRDAPQQGIDLNPVAHANHSHANVLSAGSTSGSLSVVGGGSSNNLSHLNPMMCMNFIIKV